MSTLTAEANHIADRAQRMARIMPSVQHAIDTDATDALQGTPQPRKRPQSAPEALTEPPTGHTDPTGDAATNGAVTAVKRRERRIHDALHDIDRALDHLERTMRAEITTPAPQAEAPRNELCESPGNCRRLKETGSRYCAECGLALQRLEREDAPTCWTCTERPVESWRRADGTTAYRRMSQDTAGNWHPIEHGPPPECERCRRHPKNVGDALDQASHDLLETVS